MRHDASSTRRSRDLGGSEHRSASSRLPEGSEQRPKPVLGTAGSASARNAHRIAEQIPGRHVRRDDRRQIDRCPWPHREALHHEAGEDTGHVTGDFFIHGGVWIAGDFENHKRLVRDLVVGTGAAAVFVEYTPIPDAIYPTQLEEIYAAAKWVVSKGLENGLDGSRMAVAGNSVGGNMSAALAMMAKDRNGPKIALQVLMVPATDASVDTASYHEFASGFFLARAFMKFGWDIYVPAKRTRDMPYVSPLRASLDQLRGLPPALVITAQFDPLRDEGEAYAAKLKQAGVPVVATRYNGTIHDFVALNGVLNDPETQGAIQQACDQLKAHLF